MFASRTNHWQSSVNQLEGIREQLPKNLKVFDLTQSNPTQAELAYPLDWLNALEVSKALNYDPQSFGLKQTRQAVCQYYQQAGYEVSLGQVVLTSSTSEAYGFLMRLLVNPYEKVLIPKPSYPLFSYLLDIHDVAYDYYDLLEDGSIDRNSFEKAFDSTVKAMMVVSPNNPTGQGICIEDKAWLVEMIEEKKIALIVDEVFADYSWDDKSFLRFVSEQKGLVFVLNGLSKIVALPQMKLGWIIVTGNSMLVTESLKRLEVIADTYLSVNTPVQWAAIQWLKEKQRIQGIIKERLKGNLKWLDSMLPANIKRKQALGGWYVLLELLDTYDDENIAIQLLQEDQVMVFPGYFFDIANDHTLVVSLLTQPDIFQEGMNRLCAKVS